MKKTTYALIAAIVLLIIGAAVSPVLIVQAQKRNPNMTVMSREEWNKERKEKARHHAASDTIYVSQSDEQADTIVIAGVPDSELPD